MSQEQLGLFECEEPPIPKPKRKPPAATKVTWTKIKNLRGIKCDDCMALYIEQEHPPLARAAQFRRTVGGLDFLLCSAHAEVYSSAEQLARVKAGRDEHSKGKSRYQ